MLPHNIMLLKLAREKTLSQIPEMQNPELFLCKGNFELELCCQTTHFHWKAFFMFLKLPKKLMLTILWVRSLTNQTIVAKTLIWKTKTYVAWLEARGEPCGR